MKTRKTMEMTITKRKEWYGDRSPVVVKICHPRTIQGVYRIIRYWQNQDPFFWINHEYNVIGTDGRPISELDIEMFVKEGCGRASSYDEAAEFWNTTRDN